MGKLAAKVAVVTGASKGIGAAIAKRLAVEGASVVVHYRSDIEGANRVVSEILAGGGQAVSVAADVTQEQDVLGLFEAVQKVYGRVDVLINNAGVYAFVGIASVTPEEYRRQFDVNVLGLLLVTKAALPLFPTSGGSIVNIGSVTSTLAPPNSTLAAGSKGAVDTITKSLAKELAPRAIRVNSVNPGIVVTEGYRAAGLIGSPFERAAVALTPMGRVGTPDDIVPPVVFLASEDAGWITGETMIAAGGEGV